MYVAMCIYSELCWNISLRSVHCSLNNLFLFNTFFLSLLVLFPTINHPHPRRHNSTCQLFREFQSLHSHFTLCCIWLFPFPLQQLVLYLRFSTHSRVFLCVTVCYCYYCTHSTMVELMIMENFFSRYVLSVEILFLLLVVWTWHKTFSIFPFQ